MNSLINQMQSMFPGFIKRDTRYMWDKPGYKTDLRMKVTQLYMAHSDLQ